MYDNFEDLGYNVNAPLMAAPIRRYIRSRTLRMDLVGGGTLSVLVGEAAYSTPRTVNGPWVEVEVGILGDPAPFVREVLSDYADSENFGPESLSVYSYVPIEAVAVIVDSFGDGMWYLPPCFDFDAR